MSVNSPPSNPFLVSELDVIASIPDGQAYYDYIQQNVELDRSNPKNSHFMYAKGKVDSIDLTKPCLFTEAASSLPDIDTDFPTDRREEAISYVVSKYGADRVCQIATFGSLQGRSALKAVLRVDGSYPFDVMNKLTEEIPDEADISDQLEDMEERSIIMWSLINKADKLKGFAYLEDGEIKGEFAEIFRKAVRLEGTIQSQGKHPAGVVISGDVVSDIFPLAMSKDGELISALDMNALEKSGGVKFDFLGVDILNKVSSVKEVTAENIPLDDEETWDLIGEGRTKGCFQIESYLGRHWAKRTKPTNIKELSDLISIIRPGTLNAKAEDGKTMTAKYADRKMGLEAIESMHPAIDHLVNPTQGIIVYQETAMKIAATLAGFNMAQCNKLRKAAGKKLAELMKKVKVEFIAGCLKNNVTEEDALRIFGIIEKSNRYSFNFSHGIGYAIPAYWSAYIKTHYPLQFYKEWMSTANHKPKPHIEMKQLVMSAKLDGIEIVPPSVTHKEKGFFINGETVVFGLNRIKGVSEKELDKLFGFAEGYNEVDFLFKIAPTINKRTVEALIDVGALSHLKRSRSYLRHYYDCVGKLTELEEQWLQARNFDDVIVGLTSLARVKKDGGGCANVNRVTAVNEIISRLQNPGRDLKDLPSVIAQTEDNLMGVTLSGTYLAECLDEASADTTCKDFLNGKRGKMTILGEIKEVKIHVIKKKGKNEGKSMAFLKIGDDDCEIENVVVFPEAFELYSPILYDQNTVVIYGEREKGKDAFVVEKVAEV